ncbi:Pr6Pr family membrane protein [Qipengyuania nanhaisediminis]|nr:Pr6Pr family membrane protein [Qipengyuania nanhaisediminis]
MTTQFKQRARLTAGLISAAAFAALIAQAFIGAGPDTNPLVAFAQLMRFFTIWSNLAAAMLMGWIALRGSTHSSLPFALATALAIVAIVYHALLAQDHHPVGLDWYTNQMHHTLVPLAVIAWWIAFTEPSDNTWNSVPAVMVAPVLYTVFALTYGEASGFYAYFFLDVARFGYGPVLANILGLAVVFMIFGLILLGLRRLLSARA